MTVHNPGTSPDIATILAEVAGLNGEAMRGTNNAALASVLGALNTAEAAGGVTDTDLVMAYVKQIVVDSELLVEHENHATVIFPESTANLCILTAHADANTWTGWTEIADDQGVPVLLSSKFATYPGHITAMLVEETNQDATRFMIEISYGASKTIISRHRVLTETNKLPTAQSPRVRGALIPAGETVYYRAMCATAAAKTLNVHFRYFLHE
ncbi:MAG TPA: hypothetical protein VMW53_07245 [archaeon]|nr:hypothetical protein [archaeon]